MTSFRFCLLPARSSGRNRVYSSSSAWRRVGDVGWLNQWVNAGKAGRKEGGEGGREGKRERKSGSHPEAVSTQTSVVPFSLAQQLSTVYKTWKSVSKHVWIDFYGLLINPIKMATTQQFSENARAKFFFFFSFLIAMCAIHVTPTHSYFCGPKNFLLNQGYFKWGFT